MTHRHLVLSFSIALAACLGPTQPTPARSESYLRSQLERADLAVREARLADAEAILVDLSTSNPRLPDVWLQLGNIYSRQSQFEAAMRIYRNGLRYRPEDGRLWHNLALIELRQATRTLETASLTVPPDSPVLPRIHALHRALTTVGSPSAPPD